MFRWKLITFIHVFPTMENLHKSQIKPSANCIMYKTIDNYQHFLTDCLAVKELWSKIREILIKINYDKEIILKHLVIGYKIHDQNYWGINIIFTVISFTIYKY